MNHRGRKAIRSRTRHDLRAPRDRNANETAGDGSPSSLSFVAAAIFRLSPRQDLHPLRQTVRQARRIAGWLTRVPQPWLGEPLPLFKGLINQTADRTIALTKQRRTKDEIMAFVGNLAGNIAWT
jgi:hypothetical protein